MIDAGSEVGCWSAGGSESSWWKRRARCRLSERSAPFFVLPLGLLAGEVFLGGGVVLRAGDRDDVQRVVELPVAAAVEPVLGAFA